MNNNQYMNLIAYNNPLQNTPNINQNLQSNQYLNNLNINNILNFNPVNRNLSNPININLNPISNSLNNLYAYNNEVIKPHVDCINNINNLVFNKSLFNPAFQVNCAMTQMPILATNFDFNSINKVQDTLKINSFNFNEFNDSVKLNNNSNNFNQINLLGNKLNHGIENFKCSINQNNNYSNDNNNNLINDFSNPIFFQNQTNSNEVNQANNNLNYSENVLKYLRNLKNLQSDSQGTYNKNLFNSNVDNIKINENFGNTNNNDFLHVMSNQIKNHNSELLNNTINKYNLNINKIYNNFNSGETFKNIKENLNVQVNNSPHFFDFIKQININFKNNCQTNEESCDINKVLNCYLFLKKHNLIKNSNTVNDSNEIFSSIKENDSNLIKKQILSESNKNLVNESINPSTKNQNNNSNNNSNNNKSSSNNNNITNNYNYILNNYNVNITPNEGTKIFKSLTNLVLEKEINANARANEQTNSKSNKEKNNSNSISSEREKASEVLNAILNSKALSAAMAEKTKSLSENISSESVLHLKGQEDTRKLKASFNDKKIKLFPKNPFCLEKMPIQINPDNSTTISKKKKSSFNKSSIAASSSHSSSSESYKAAISQQNKKLSLKSKKKAEKAKEKEKKILTRTSNLTSSEKAEEVEEEKENKEFNCYNEFYLDGERNVIFKKELEEYSQYYEEDLAETLKDEKHAFMHSHFPEMYLKKDNFFLNIKMLNKKRKTQALLNSAYQRSRNYFRKHFNKKLNYSDSVPVVKSESKFNDINSNINSNKIIGDVYDIFYNLVNEDEMENLNFKNNCKNYDYNSSYKEKIKDVFSSEEKNYGRKNSINNSNIDIEINLNMNQDSDSNHSAEKANYRKKSFEEAQKQNEEFNKYLNNPNYTFYTDNQGIKIINSVDIIDLKNTNKNANEEFNFNKENKNAFTNFDKNNINSSNVVINKIWDNKSIEHDKGNNIFSHFRKKCFLFSNYYILKIQ